MFLIGFFIGEMVGGIVTLIIVCALKMGKEADAINCDNKYE